MIATTRTVVYLDRPTAGWFPLDIMYESDSKRDWVALMIDVEPDDLESCTCEFPALLYVHPKKYRPGPRKVEQRWLRVPGEHRNKAAAWDALMELIETRH